MGRGVAIRACLLLLSALGLSACAERPQLSPEAIALNNRGVALMGYFDYPRAHAAFSKLTELHPDFPEAKINLAIATLNRQLEGDEKRAMDLLAEVLEGAPNHLRARYCVGLLHLYLGETHASLEHFLFVAQSDPADADAAYYVGQNLLQQGEVEASLSWYLKALERDEYLRSAYYGAAQVLRRLGRREEAAAMLADYQRFENNPRARLAEFKYTRMGSKAEALAVDLPGSPATVAPPDGGLFGRYYDLSRPVEGTVSLSTADIDGDGAQDLFFARTLGTVVLTAQPDGTYGPAEQYPFADRVGVIAGLWGDLDNDGLTDVYLCREGPNELWRQAAPGEWEDASDATGTADGGDCADAALFDADHDGDLDIFVVNRSGHNELYNNNRDGSYRRLAAEHGLAGSADGSLGLLTIDLDHDRDVDLVVLARSPPHGVYLNDRLWRYRDAAGFGAFRSADVQAAVGGDLDADGRADIVSLDGSGRLWWWTADDDGGWSAREVVRRPVRGRGELSLVDFSGDGRQEILWRHTEGFSLYALRGGSSWEERLAFDGEIQALAAVLQYPSRGPSLVGVLEGVSLRVWPPGPGRHAFAALRLTGKEKSADSMRSNASGIGTQVALRNGSVWTLTDTFDKSSAPGQSLQPLALGLGAKGSADYLAINWSDGVFQTELGVGPGLTTIAETQRQLSSCPVLFAWNGVRFEFVSDVLGVGGLGAFVAPGRYAAPRPWEFFALPQGALRQRDGRYQLKLSEPMEESAYLDLARLHVYDLARGWSMGLDERLTVKGPPASGEPFFYRREILPSSARNERGQDVTDALRHADRRAAPLGELDPRFIGRLSAPQRLELAFAEALPRVARQGRLVLVADAWVEYPYSQTGFAAWQANAAYDAPTLEARDGAGRWHIVAEQFGYPAGMPREMALPLPRLPAGTDALALTTNREIYWDRIRVVVDEVLGEKRVTTIDVAEARLMKSGFPLRSTGAQRVPDYDYQHRSVYWDTKYPSGRYTRLGPMTPLITARDDALAIFGPGEEIHMEFPAPVGEPEAGFTRHLVLEVRGYAKDMDMYTLNGETVGPLPVTLSADDPDLAARREALHRRYNTRFLAGK